MYMCNYRGAMPFSRDEKRAEAERIRKLKKREAYMKKLKVVGMLLFIAALAAYMTAAFYGCAGDGSNVNVNISDADQTRIACSVGRIVTTLVAANNPGYIEPMKILAQEGLGALTGEIDIGGAVGSSLALLAYLDEDLLDKDDKLIVDLILAEFHDSISLDWEVPENRDKVVSLAKSFLSCALEALEKSSAAMMPKGG